MFLFYLLGVGLPCRLIFCQFWLCEEAQCVYLRRHLGSLLRVSALIYKYMNAYFYHQLTHIKVIIQLTKNYLQNTFLGCTLA